MKKILLPIMVFIYSANISAGPLTLDCQSSTEMDENLKDIAAATTGGTNGADECPAPSMNAINDLCIQVGGRLPDEDENSPFDHKYEKTLWGMSCANPLIDNAETAKPKVKKMWDKYHTHLKCSRTNFLVSDGNILKYGAQNSFEDFIVKIVDDYKLNINFIDPKDNKTVLDFVYEEKTKLFNKDPHDKNYLALESMYQRLVKLHAVHAKDIRR